MGETPKKPVPKLVFDDEPVVAPSGKKVPKLDFDDEPEKKKTAPSGGKESSSETQSTGNENLTPLQRLQKQSASSAPVTPATPEEADNARTYMQMAKSDNTSVVKRVYPDIVKGGTTPKEVIMPDTMTLEEIRAAKGLSLAAMGNKVGQAANEQNAINLGTAVPEQSPEAKEADAAVKRTIETADNIDPVAADKRQNPVFHEIADAISLSDDLTSAAKGKFAENSELIKEYISDLKVLNPTEYRRLKERAEGGLKFKQEDLYNLLDEVTGTGLLRDIAHDQQVIEARLKEADPEGQFEAMAQQRSEMEQQLRDMAEQGQQDPELYAQYEQLSQQMEQMNEQTGIGDMHNKLAELDEKFVSGFKQAENLIYEFPRIAENYMKVWAQNQRLEESPISSTLKNIPWAITNMTTDFLKNVGFEGAKLIGADQIADDLATRLSYDTYALPDTPVIDPETGDINGYQLAPNVASMLVAQLAIYGKGAQLLGGIFKAAGAGKASASLGLVTISAMNSFGSYYAEASKKMSDSEAIKYAFSQAALQSLLELVNPNSRFLSLSPAARKGMVSAYTAALARGENMAFKSVLKYAREIGGEITQEELQLIAEAGVKGYTNFVAGQKLLEGANPSLTEFGTTALVTAITTAIGAGGVLRIKNSGAVKEAYTTLAVNHDKFLKAVADMEASKKYTPEQIETIKKTEESYKKAFDSTPKNLTVDQRAKLTPLLVERDRLERENEGLAAPFQKANKENMAKLDEQINFIAYGVKPAEPKKDADGKVKVEPPPPDVTKDIRPFAERIVKGEKMDSQFDVDFYKDNAEAIDEEIVKIQEENATGKAVPETKETPTQAEQTKPAATATVPAEPAKDVSNDVVAGAAVQPAADSKPVETKEPKNEKETKKGKQERLLKDKPATKPASKKTQEPKPLNKKDAARVEKEVQKLGYDHVTQAIRSVNKRRKTEYKTWDSIPAKTKKEVAAERAADKAKDSKVKYSKAKPTVAKTIDKALANEQSIEHVEVDGVSMEFEKHKDGIRLSSISSKDKGQGNASRALKEAIGYADKKGVPIYLEADAKAGGMSQEALVKFYEKNGFIFDGTKAVRQPQAEEKTEAKASKFNNPVTPQTKEKFEGVLSKLKRAFPNVTLERPSKRKWNRLLKMASRSNSKLQMAAYHGSPHDFDKFTTEKIGTGEGNQVFGWGLYFSSEKRIAEFYADALRRDGKVTIDGMSPMAFLVENDIADISGMAEIVLTGVRNKTKAEAIAHAKNVIDRNNHDIKQAQTNDPDKEPTVHFRQDILEAENADMESLIKALEKVKEFKREEAAATVYEVMLNEGKEEGKDYDWLQWDEVMPEHQQEKVIEHMKDFFEMTPFQQTILDASIAVRADVAEIADALRNENMDYVDAQSVAIIAATIRIEDGRRVYEVLKATMREDFMRSSDPAKEASLWLLDAGIDGVKYPAETIAKKNKDAKDRASNFVVFDDSAVTVKQKVRFLNTPTGEVYGMLMDGEIYLNPDHIRLDTPIHEYGHIWLDMAKHINPVLYKNLTNSIQGTEYEQGALDAYPDIVAELNAAAADEVRLKAQHAATPKTKTKERAKLNSEIKQAQEAQTEAKRALLEEAVVQAIADDGVKIVNRTRAQRVKDYLKNLWETVLAKLGIKQKHYMNMTWNDLVHMAARDILAGKVITKADSSMIAKVDESAWENGISIEGGILDTTKSGFSKLVSGKGKVHPDIGSWLAETFKPHGKYKEMHHLQTEAKRNITGRFRQIQERVFSWKRALKEYSDGLTGTKVQKDAAMEQAFEAVNDYMKSNRSVHALRRVPRPLQGVVKDMRDDVDGLSQLLLQAGYIDPGSNLHASISANLGVYMNRSYAAFGDKEWNKKMFPAGASKGKREKAFENRYNKAFSFLRAKINNHTTVDGNLYLVTRDAMNNVTGAEDALGNAITDPALMTRIIASYQAKEKVTDDQINYWLKDFAGAASTKDFTGSGAVIGSLDTNFFKKKQDIAPEIRAFLGEYTDPDMAFTKTMMNLARFVENTKYLEKLKELGEGKVFFDNHNKSEGYDVPVPDFNNKFSPMYQMFTSPEIAALLKEDRYTDPSFMTRIIRQLNFWVKAGKTVGSIKAQVRNFASNFLLSFSNGYYSPVAFSFMSKNGINPFKLAREEFLGRGGEVLAELARVGAVDQSANGKDLEDITKIAFGESLRLPLNPSEREMENFFTETLPKWASKAGMGASKMYQLGDNIHKIFNYYAEKAHVQYMFPNLSAQEVEQMAGERYRKVNVIYDMAPKFVTRLRRNVFLSSFPTFAAEVIRISWNIPKLAARDIREGFNTGNRQQLTIGLNRLGSYHAAMFGFSLLMRALSNMVGGDDEDEYLIRTMNPEYSKNNPRILVDKSGVKYKYMDFGWQNPYSFWEKGYNAFVGKQDEGENEAHAFMAAMMTVADPFISPEITLETMWDAFKNEKNRVFNPEADTEDILIDVANFVWDKVKPGVIDDGGKWILGALEREENGRKYDLPTEVGQTFSGQKFYQMDALNYLPKLAARYRKHFDDDMEIYKKEYFKSTNKEGQSERIDAAYKVANEKYHKRQAELIRYVDILKRKGVNEDDIYDKLSPLVTDIRRNSAAPDDIIEGEIVDLYNFDDNE